jgi:hypothetical protein
MMVLRAVATLLAVDPVRQLHCRITVALAQATSLGRLATTWNGFEQRVYMIATALCCGLLRMYSMKASALL